MACRFQNCGAGVGTPARAASRNVRCVIQPGAVGADEIAQTVMREFYYGPGNRRSQLDTDPRFRLIGELPRHGQPMRLMGLGHDAAAQVAVTMVDYEPSV